MRKFDEVYIGGDHAGAFVILSFLLLEGFGTMKTTFLAGLIGAALIATAAPATVTVSYEAAGVQDTTAAISGKQIATFDQMSGYQGSGTSLFSGPITGTITNGGFVLSDANVYGGAGGTGKYASVYDTTSIKLSQAVTYAGLWASAIDGDFSTTLGNTVSLFSGDTLLGSFALKPLLAGASSAYNGNPNFGGQDGNEPFAFFNFNSTTAFDRIDITQNGGGGFELDNITIGKGPGAVPEPASWAMMIVGFGVTGAVLRSSRRRKNAIRA
jgi:hypothetical protein